MKNEIISAIEELQKRMEGLTDQEEIAECFADYKAELKGERKDLNQLEWDEIEQLMKSPSKKKMFKIGSCKEEELYTGEKVKIQLISLNPDDEVVSEDNKANAAFMFFIDGEYEMNEQCTNSGGWGESKMRKTYMERFFKLLPEKLQKVIKTAYKKTALPGTGTIINTPDKLFLPSEIEVTGEVHYSHEGEGKVYEYFKNNELPAKWIWLRSPCATNATSFCGWNIFGCVYYNIAYSALRVALCFCI